MPGVAGWWLRPCSDLAARGGFLGMIKGTILDVLHLTLGLLIMFRLNYTFDPLTF